MMRTEISELYNTLQRFINRQHKMHIPLEQDDDDMIISNAFDELEKLREENKRLQKENEILIYRNAELKQHLESIEHTAQWEGSGSDG